nr:hypothetical protein [Tanacetum cinerariifolium]
HPSSRAAVSVKTARPINTAYPRSTVNDAKPSSNVFHKLHSPVRRTFNQRIAPQHSDLKETVNIAKGNPEYTLQDQEIFNSGCSRHMTGNKSFLTDYQEIENDHTCVACQKEKQHRASLLLVEVTTVEVTADDEERRR